MCDLEQKQILQYDKDGCNFLFQKLNEAQILRLSQTKYIENVCDNYLVSLRRDLKDGFIEVDY